MFPTQTAAMQFTTVTAVREHYQLPDPVWRSFIEVCGDPNDDLKLLAVLPPRIVAASLERAQLPEGSFLSAIQASHVGLVYNLARRIVHTRGGGDWDSWKESSPFGDRGAPGPEGVATQGQDSQTSPKAERKLKMNNIIDQADDGEFTVQNEDTKAAWYQRYLEVVGGWPQEEEEPTMEQLSGVQRRLQVQDTAPYVDFAIFVPYGSKALRASKFRNYTLTSSGYTTKDLPGPSGFIQWRACFRILRTTLIMLDAVSLAALHNYEAHVERLTRTFSTAWHLIYSADELARSSHSNRLRSQLLMDLRGGRTAPRNWDPARPWDWVFQQLILDDAFWQTQVVGPALTWLAAGSRGTPKTPSEQLAMSYMEGGLKAITPSMDSKRQHSRSASRTWRRKKKRNGQAEERGSPEPKGSGDGGGKKGKKGKGKGATKQKCYSWNNGTPPCGGLSPRQTCAGKVQRLHRCTVCNSPGHPSKSCPNRMQE